MAWRKEDPEGNSSWIVRWEIVQYTRGRGLDVGCGAYDPSQNTMGKPFPHFIGVDNGKQWGTRGVDVVADASDLGIFASQSMDFVFSSHLLEHIEDYRAALAEWWRVIKPGGHLVLYLPHRRLCPNIGQDGANPDHKHDFFTDDIISAMRELPGSSGWDMIVNEIRNGEFEFSFLQVYRKNGNMRLEIIQAPHKKKTAAVVRYGGFGDMIQASSVLPALKEAGYHVMFYTTPSGWDILRDDPHIDAWHIQDKMQVLNQDLPAFWAWHQKKFDRWINLSGSVEGAFLACEGYANHTWPQPLRHWFMDRNYLEFTHLLAGVPMPPRHRFYPSTKEKEWAARIRHKMQPGKVVLWVLSGSSPHKTWPYMDSVIANLMLSDRDTKVVLVGDEMCKMLETGWEKEPRVILKSGEWSIRQTMAFASEAADLVVGPETGVMFAVGLLDVPKVLFLSHASVENLSRDWVNCHSFAPDPGDCACYPCHMLHQTFQYCSRDEKTGVAKCQAVIQPGPVAQKVKELLRNGAIRKAA